MFVASRRAPGTPQAREIVLASDPIIPKVTVRRDDGTNPIEGNYLDLIRDEIEAINTRPERAEHKIDPDTIADDSVLNVIGLALSGGGIRSSATCLGVLQGLHHHRWLDKIDYLSTVSGGGYIGCAMTTTMAQSGEFVFSAHADNATAAEVSDTQAVGHIRNYSNYLFPNGLRDVMTALAIVVRGLIANVLIGLPFILLSVIVTVHSTPTYSALGIPNFFGYALGEQAAQSGLKTTTLPFTLSCFVIGILAAFYAVLYDAVAGRPIGRNRLWLYLIGVAVAVGITADTARWFTVDHFAMTLAAACLGFAYFAVWAVVRSFAGTPEVGRDGPTAAATVLALIAIIAFFEFQPFMLAAMFDAAQHAKTADHPFAHVVSQTIAWFVTLAAPFTAVVTVFRQKFGEWVRLESSNSWAKQLMAWAAKVALWIGGAALPLVIWVGYLYLCFWAVNNDCAPALKTRPATCPVVLSEDSSKAISGTFKLDVDKAQLAADVKPVEKPQSKTDADKAHDHAPQWIGSHRDRILLIYAAIAVLFYAIAKFLTANANSLHRLYRDRLSKAFLFKTAADEYEAQRNDTETSQNVVFPPNDTVKLSELWPIVIPASSPRQLRGPYHLVNAALNVQGSDFANRRGRNADFFLFSPRYVGSDATGYCSTLKFEEVSSIDVPTAMAISGAAFSSNMGAESIRPLTPTLALLNVRLGYWLKNPRYADRKTSPVTELLRKMGIDNYLWSELSGRLYENSDEVYLTDGGHIENLGIYQLLRRRCRVIVAVDAEADAGLNFTSFVRLQRYARIDLGIRIELAWEPIQLTTRAWMCQNEGSPQANLNPTKGPHIAIGTIDYGGGQKGTLIYVKSSLSGDESDYICDYARRNPTFPHESTIDQMFTEEQFEVYRALGFHMIHGWLSNTDGVAATPSDYATWTDLREAFDL